MNEFGLLLQIVGVFAATAAPIVVVVRLIAGRDADSVAGILESFTGLCWPLGVQAEEPLPWNFGPASI